MRILHLVDPASSGGGGCTLRTLAEAVARIDEMKHDVLVLGTASDEIKARRCGLLPIGSVARSARRTLAPVISAYERVFGRYDLIHSWTVQAGATACAAAPRRRHLASVTRAPDLGHIVQTLKTLRPRVVAPFEQVRSKWIEVGFPASAVSLVTPGIEMSSIDASGRENLRKRWHIAPKCSTLAIGMMHEAASELDAHVAMTIAARLALSGLCVRVIVPPEARGRAEAEIVSHRLGFSNELLAVEDELDEPWQVVGGLDVAVCIGGRGEGDLAPLLWAMAAAVPVIAEARGAAGELIEEGVTGLLVPPGDINAVCDRLDRLYHDRDAARRLGAAAGASIRERFSIAAFCDGLQSEYVRTA